MNRSTFVLALGFGVLALTAQHAFSQPRQTCAPRADVLRELADRWGESRRAVMLAGRTRVFELFAEDESGTWTILQTRPDGETCVIAWGTAYERVPIPAGGDPA